MKAMVLAAGVGSRLDPLTAAVPKPLVPVANIPVMEHIVTLLKHHGINDIVANLHYLPEKLVEYFGDGSRWGVRIEYLREDAPLGTAGALSLLDPRPTMPFIVTNGDVLTDIRYGELLDFHQRNAAAATMAVRLYEWQHPFGVVHTRGVEIVGLEEKPVHRSHVNAGVYALSPDVLELLREAEHCDMPTLFASLRSIGMRTVVYPMHEPWLDVGRPADYDEAEKSISGKMDEEH